MDVTPLDIVTCWAKSQELGACCRPTETGAGPSDARIAAAASHFTDVFLACAWCCEISRILENPMTALRETFGGKTTTLPAVCALPDNCSCVHLRPALRDAH